MEDNKEGFEHLTSFDEFDKEAYDAFKVRFMSDVQELTKYTLKLFNIYALLLTFEILCSLSILTYISKFDKRSSYFYILYIAIIVIYSTIIAKILLFIKNDKKVGKLMKGLQDNKRSIARAFIAVRMNSIILDIKVFKVFAVAYLLLIISIILY